MSECMGLSWKCERCKTLVNDPPWNCPVCGKETCDSCFDRYAVCRDCAGNKPDEVVKKMSGKDWDEETAPPTRRPPGEPRWATKRAEPSEHERTVAG